MTPATHAAIGAVSASMARRPGVGLLAAFLSHFVFDWVFHFEAFYPMSRAIGTDHRTAAIVASIAVAAVVAPIAYRLSRGSHEMLVFCVFLFAQTVAMADPRWLPRLLVGGLFAGLAMLYRRRSPELLWYAAGWAANLPDVLKRAAGWFAELHSWFHYEGRHDLGDWIHVAANGQSLPIPFRFDSPYYLAGYTIELLLELGLLLGSLVWLRAHLTPGASDLASPPQDSKIARGLEDSGGGCENEQARVEPLPPQAEAVS